LLVGVEEALLPLVPAAADRKDSSSEDSRRSAAEPFPGIARKSRWEDSFLVGAGAAVVVVVVVVVVVAVAVAVGVEDIANSVD